MTVQEEVKNRPPAEATTKEPEASVNTEELVALKAEVDSAKALIEANKREIDEIGIKEKVNQEKLLVM